MDTILTIDHIKYNYPTPGGSVAAIKDASASFSKGKVYAITGSSGSGKSTLLSLMSGLDNPQEGSIDFKGKSLKTMNRNHYRSHYIGIVFQAFNLLSHFTALENVTLSLELCNSPNKSNKRRAYELLAKVGINETKAKRRVLRLSGGEQQRVAIARALATDPELIFADEPTGNLDSKTSTSIMEEFLSIAHKENRCVIIVTHSNSLAKQADEIWGMKDGILLPVKTS